MRGSAYRKTCVAAIGLLYYKEPCALHVDGDSLLGTVFCLKLPISLFPDFLASNFVGKMANAGLVKECVGVMQHLFF